ncbi:MAG: hypothetical protein KGO93_01890 [Cyanobacteria bacterium REEB446]|jgi:hypothetical protein|nr:hypothetical protein [Cyanobacteria bacterium REEB446]
MNPLVAPVAVGFSVYALAGWLRNHIAPAANLDKSSVAFSASQRRDRAAQLCAT